MKKRLLTISLILMFFTCSVNGILAARIDVTESLVNEFTLAEQEPDYISLADCELRPDPMNLEVGGRDVIVVYPPGGYREVDLVEPVTFVSADESIATVDEDGFVDGLKKGTTTITVRGELSGVTKTLTVNVISTSGIDINLGELDQSTVKDHYGDVVTNIAGIDWALYYVDYDGYFGEEGTIFLKALSRITNVAQPGSSSSTTALAIMKQLNPMWAEARGDLPTSKFNRSEKATLCMCDPVFLRRFNIEEPDAISDGFKAKYGEENYNYAIAGPSVELFMASYNSRKGLNSRWQVKMNLEASEPGYIYTIDKGRNWFASYSLSGTGMNVVSTLPKSLYVYDATYILSSPAVGFGNLCAIMNDGSLAGLYNTNPHSLMPIVSLKPTADLTK